MNFGRYKVWLSGPVLVGFNELFDAAYGDPKTPKPYVKVTPALVGGVLLPFACPHCESVRPEMVHPKRSLGYKDVRGFSWCPAPACRKRYILNTKGAPPAEEIAVGATHAPALVERDGKVSVIGGKSDGLKLLGSS